MHDAQRRSIHTGPPRFVSNRHPNFVWCLRGEPVKAQRRQQADHAMRYAFGGFGKRVMLSRRAAFGDVQSPAPPVLPAPRSFAWRRYSRGMPPRSRSRGRKTPDCCTMRATSSALESVLAMY